MKRHLKIIMATGLAIAGLIIIYQFVIMPKQKADKLESAKRDAFFECDKRWAKISSQTPLLTKQLFQDSDTVCEYKKSQQDKNNTRIENNTLYSRQDKDSFKDYTDFEFFVDSPLFCQNGKTRLHNRDSYMEWCEEWYLSNLGFGPWAYYPLSSHYH